MKSKRPPQPIEAADDTADIPDRRLGLMFACAHPAIDRAIRAPLMLQAILGLDAARIASAFLISPATMSQRLVRAKNKIRHAGIPLEIPERSELRDAPRHRARCHLRGIRRGLDRCRRHRCCTTRSRRRSDLSRPRDRRVAARRTGRTWPSRAHAARRSAHVERAAIPTATTFRSRSRTCISGMRK